VLLHNPGNARHAFQRDLDGIEWSGGEEELAAWAAGRTGYPIVDAGMRQLAAIGWMHDRARLITAKV
jgi:deoxyribodipyrimidine photo-lyase